MAPSISKFDDVYYAHYSVSTFGSQNSQIGLATATNLSGPWKDLGSLNLPQNAAYNLIDPFVFQNSSNEPVYFTFGSYWSGIQQFPIASPQDLQTVDGSITDAESIHPIVTNSTANAAVVEGAITYKHDDRYYLFFSVGACCNIPPNLAPPGDEYRVAVCRADAVTGPYTDREGKNCKTDNGGTTVLASHGDVYAPGGQGVMKLSGEDREVLYYHYVRPSVGYNADQFFFGWNYLNWTMDGWPVISGQ
ncbi:hypothetical protein E8E13_006144 [Curvularia kusanoi]|uniref:Endo-1,5-alpha-L-arabinanase A n=1 Tax=Curvularia kusanoi TaxID=90978 RepID=A0A9P4TAX7_CURKU|nr:hypothetical protein E8E13_006144 [Curvularia kusanoi]